MISASARERAGWLALALFPVLAFAALEFSGYTKLARLGGFALGAAAGGVVLFLRPRWALYSLICYIFSGVGLFLPFNFAAPALGIIVAAAALSVLRGDRLVVPGTYFWVALALFTMVSLLSMLVARDVGASFRTMFTFAKILLVVLLIVHLIRTPDQLRGLYYAVFAGAVATVVLGVLGVAAGLAGAGENYIGGVHIMRFTGAHENPNKAAAYMCSAVPLGLFAIRSTRSRAARAAFIAGVLVLIVGIFTTFSRSVIIPLTVVAIGVVAYELRSRRSVVVFATIIALGVLLAPRYYWDRVFSLPDVLRDSTQDWSVFTRMLAVRTAWEMFTEHPLTGVGLGNFLDSSAYRLFVRIPAHNTYLEVLVETGVAGLCAFLAVMASGLRHAVAGARRRWRAHPEWMRSLCYYTVLSAVSIGLSALFSSMAFRYPLWIPVAAGLVIGHMLRADAQG